MSKYAPIDLKPYGVIRDTHPFSVGEEWTNALNMRFNDLAVEKIGGETEAIATTVESYFLLFNGKHVGAEWFYMADGGIWSTDLVTNTDLDTGGNVTTGTIWDASLFNNIPVFNNTVQAPWTWTGAGDVTPLPAFPATMLCQAIRPYKSFLVALNLIEGGIESENRVLWSSSSDAGALPASWDITDPTVLAGDAYLTSTKGRIIDGLSLRDLFVIYKTHAIHVMRLVGGQTVMKFEKIQVNSGLMAKNCVQEFKGMHFVVSDGDVILFDGQSVKSIADKRVRTEIFTNIDTQFFANAYVARYDRQDEMWFCYPTIGNEWANRAAIWNWKDDTWTFRTLSSSRHIASGQANKGSFTYDSPTAAVTYDDPSLKIPYAPLSDNPTTDTLVAANSSFRLNQVNPDIGFNAPGSWSLQTGATISGSQLTFVSSNFGNAIIGSNEDIAIGDSYRTVIDIESLTGTGIRLILGGQLVSPNITTSGTYDFVAMGTGSNQIGLQVASTDTDAVVNSFELYRLRESALSIIDEGFNSFGIPMVSSLEKLTMDLGTDDIKIVKSVAPRITADVGTKVYISAGYQFEPDEQITWMPEILYTVGVDRKSDIMLKGRYISVKFRTQDLDTNWRLHSFHIDAAASGSY